MGARPPLRERRREPSHEHDLRVRVWASLRRAAGGGDLSHGPAPKRGPRSSRASIPGELPRGTIVFCDGASSGNPGAGGWGAIVVEPEGTVLELGGHAARATNNQMELTAAIRALEAVRGQKEVVVHTDSTYVIRGATQWIWGWMKRDWVNAAGAPVANRELWERLHRLGLARKRFGGILWRYVPGHRGVPGNERVDEIAVSFSQGRPVRLYRGPLLRYGVAIHDLPEEGFPLPEPRAREKPKAAFCYLSEIGGVVERHATWAECERRVKGRSGARFKKAMSEEEEREIREGWGDRAARPNRA